MFNLLGGVGLPIAIVIFLVSAVVVVLLGVQLARYGDALATLTGWGRLFVGSILVALATSLPELSNNITAVRIDNPQLALGNVVGANMVNMFTMGMVALVFGGRRFLQRVAPEQGYLIVLAAALTGLAVLFAGAEDRDSHLADRAVVHCAAGGVSDRDVVCVPAESGRGGR